MKILVTGGAGFIGSHVVDAYIDAGHEVVVIDNLSTGKIENINQKVKQSKKFYDADITDAKKMEEVFRKEAPIDVVNHHAAQVDVNYSISNDREDAETNIIATITLLKLGLKYEIKRFVFASSAAIYGTHEPGEGGLTENLQPLPLSPYGISKRTAEEYIKFYGRVFGLKYTILRYPNVYGQRQKSGDGGVIAIFMQNMVDGETVTIFGNGNQTRDFLFVADAAEANVKAIQVEGDGEIFNIGTEKSTKINELFLMLKEKLSYAKNATYKPERKGDVRHSKLNCTKAKTELKWRAITTLKDGLKKTYEAMKHE